MEDQRMPIDRILDNLYEFAGLVPDFVPDRQEVMCTGR